MAPTTFRFQHAIIDILYDFIPKFMQVFMDNFVLFIKNRWPPNTLVDAWPIGWRLASLNLANYAFTIYNDILLQYIISQDGRMLDLSKANPILDALVLTKTEATIARFLRKIN